jgi:hypothetical protein
MKISKTHSAYFIHGNRMEKLTKKRQRVTCKICLGYFISEDKETAKRRAITKASKEKLQNRSNP